MLLLGPYGGVVADRVDKRRLMIVLQAAMGVQALVLGVLTITGVVTLWEIGLLAALLGLNNAFEAPGAAGVHARDGRPGERCATPSASTPCSSTSPACVGPALAGILIALSGEGVCFLLNAASFAAVIASLLSARPRAPSTRASRARGARDSCARAFATSPGSPIWRCRWR